MKLFGRRGKGHYLRVGEHDVVISHNDDNVITTSGLTKYTNVELRLVLSEEDRGPEGHFLVDHIVSYVAQTGAILKASETYVFGFWVLKFFPSGDGVLEIGEMVPGTEEQSRTGASCAMRYWREQTIVCDRVGALHRPPSAGMTAMVSPGLYEPVGVEGSRYGLGDDKSGWVLIADGWQGEATRSVA
jgi:hypothetical protein